MIIWPRWASREFLSLPIVQSLLPVTFGYSLSSEAIVWDNWGDERDCDEGHWHTHTRGLPCGLPEVIRTVRQVDCSWRRLLRRGLEFHVCTINKSTHTKKSGNLFNDPRMYVCMYVYSLCVSVCRHTRIYVCIFMNAYKFFQGHWVDLMRVKMHLITFIDVFLS